MSGKLTRVEAGVQIPIEFLGRVNSGWSVRVPGTGIMIDETGCHTWVTPVLPPGQGQTIPASEVQVYERSPELREIETRIKELCRQLVDAEQKIADGEQKFRQIKTENDSLKIEVKRKNELIAELQKCYSSLLPLIPPSADPRLGWEIP